jgi:uncharacterized membrane protein
MKPITLKAKTLLVSLMLLLWFPTLALAQDATVPGSSLNFWEILATIVYGAIGILLCVLGYFAFDKLAGLDLQRELVEDQNTALGIMLAGVFVGIAIVVASAIIG